MTSITKTFTSDFIYEAIAWHNTLSFPRKAALVHRYKPVYDNEEFRDFIIIIYFLETHKNYITINNKENE